VVTHPTTNLPISGLSLAERTGCLVLLSLWSYVKGFVVSSGYILVEMIGRLEGSKVEMDRLADLGG
jgi:hypothetical protein